MVCGITHKICTQIFVNVHTSTMFSSNISQRTGLPIVTNLGLVSHICAVKSSSHFLVTQVGNTGFTTVQEPSEDLKAICMRRKSLYFSYCHRGEIRKLAPGVGVTKPISSVPLFSEFFSIVKTHVRYWISRLYLTGIAVAQLRWYLSSMNVNQRIYQLLLQDRTFCLRRT